MTPMHYSWNVLYALKLLNRYFLQINLHTQVFVFKQYWKYAVDQLFISVGAYLNVIAHRPNE